MERHLTEKQHKEIWDIMDNMSCKLDFACYKSPLDGICKAEYNKNRLVCKISEMPIDKSTLYFECEYRLYLGSNYYICKCPLRIYIAKKLNR